MARVFAHRTILDLVKIFDPSPVINGLSDFTHPCQGLADLFTIYEKKGQLSGLKLAYVGDGNNVANSLIYGCSTSWNGYWPCVPEGYEPDSRVVSEGREEARKRGKVVTNNQ